ncbi:putative mechanosensitive ion channel [Lyophyllum shimeji]|uniref:Mechanosensitive ion channel n=1 Tax=Lyophyllum shimeji TaxID=47721 RepID=A0A9P3UN71_LYOSH|nr:putative mechanosensitive ion channel [Lyophyllum shimeji]
MSSRRQAAHDGYQQVDLHAVPPNGNPGSPTMSYPPHPSSERQPSSESTSPLRPDTRGKPQVAFSSPYDPERGQVSAGQSPHSGRSRSGSWDLLAGIKKFESSYEEFDTRNASEAHLAFADGDIPKSKFVKLYNYLLNVSIVTRWLLFIVPVLGILWIPGILNLTTFPNAKVWGVKLIFWSIWLSVVWGGWWTALAVSRIVPYILRATLGVVAVGTRRYIDWIQVLHRYIALTAWTLAIWISWGPLIDNQQHPGTGAESVTGDKNVTGNKSVSASDTAARLLFAFFLCAAVLLFEKLSIQWIAGKFHERSYAERIADQKFAVRSLVTLYRHSSDIPGRSDTLRDGPGKRASVNPKRFFKKFRQGIRMAATTTTTALGNVASEIAGSSVLQPNSPQAMVKTALESANKSRLLARRLFYSFVKPGSDYLLVDDIARYFPDPGEADQVFALFDKDGNGDASRDELEMACLEFHREQLSIENSMRDLDSAVGRLDNILMSVYFIVAILIIAVALETQLLTLVTGAGTLILGLSWLIGGTLQEVLTSIIFLFVKHPFDVGDRVVVEKETYTVKEIRLLSTIFLDSNSTQVQAPNTVLNTKFIQNIRRSPQMSETFTFDVSYATTFEDLEKLREKMLEFVKAERRDYQPAFDVAVKDFPEQEKMTLTADIKYKSNCQLGALKSKRRNKWICALKTALAELHIYGPKGDPDAVPDPTRYTKVPYEEVKAKERRAAQNHPQSQARPSHGWQLADSNAVIVDESNDVFGEKDELYMTNPRSNLPEGHGNDMRHRPSAPAAVLMPTPTVASASGARPDVIEMAPRNP